MKKSTLNLTVLAASLLAFAGSVSAATYTDVPSGANAGLPFAYFGNHPNPSGDSPKVGQVFSLTSAQTLSSFSFYALGDQSTLPLQLNIATWTSNSAGATLFSTTAAVETYNGSSLTQLGFDNIGLNLNANTNYIAYLTTSSSTASVQLSRAFKTADTSGFGVAQAYYSTVSNGWVLGPNNGFLSLQYTAVTVAVPESDTYAMLLAGLGVMGFVARRKQA
jgi:hypothetical protein